MAVSVVIVDDHAGFRALARRMLDGDGFGVVGEAADGRQALDVIEALRPELVLLDVRLPGLDGFAVTERLRAAGTTAVVVLVSTRDSRDYGGRVAGSGANGFITKSELDVASLRAVAGLP